jgi:DNA-binding transcriptional ArsR family regulator/YHS domain-containing protein
MYQELFALQEGIFRTIASQKRLEIIQLLQTGELTVGEMTEMLGIRQANVSQHLSELRQAKIVATRREGTRMYYRLTDERIARACALIKLFLHEQHQINPSVLELIKDEKHLFPVVVDPVCRMRISVAHAGGSAVYQNHTYYFCASGCQQKFDKQPSMYALKEATPRG